MGHETMTMPMSEGALRRAEGGARQFILRVGIGTLSFVCGNIGSAFIAQQIEPVESEVLFWALKRLWLLGLLPLFGYVIGRITVIDTLGFSIGAALSGESFSILLTSAINGFEALTFMPQELVIRGVSLMLGIGITALATATGRQAANRAQ